MQKIFILSPLFAVCRASTGGIVNANDLWGRGPSQLGARQSAATTNATRKPYRLVDEYDAANFWDKFNFIEARFLPRALLPSPSLTHHFPTCPRTEHVLTFPRRPTTRLTRRLASSSTRPAPKPSTWA